MDGDAALQFVAFLKFTLGAGAVLVLGLGVVYAAVRLGSAAWHKGKEEYHRRMRGEP